MNKEKDCTKCIFRRFTWDKGGMPTIEICHGKYCSQEEAIAAIKADTCDLYEEGHRLYETDEVDGVKIKSLPASKQYLVDAMDFSETPVAICGHTQSGMKVCYRGEGIHCYCRLNCTSQMDLHNPSRMAPAARESLVEAMTSAGVDSSKLNV